METPCIGVDSDGRRHWLMKVSMCSVISFPLPSPPLSLSLTRGQTHFYSIASKYFSQDSNYDVRLYGESNYDEEPPAEAQWTELAR